MSTVPTGQPITPTLEERFTQPGWVEFEKSLADFQLDLYMEAYAVCAGRKEGVDSKISPEDVRKTLPKLHYRYVFVHRNKLIWYKVGTLLFGALSGYSINRASSLPDRIRGLGAKASSDEIASVANDSFAILAFAILFTVLAIICAIVDYNSEVQP